MRDGEPVVGWAEEAGDEVIAALHTRQPVGRQPSGVALMERLLTKPSASYRELTRGDVGEGSIVQIGPDEILVDIGSKSEGVIPSHEASTLTDEERTCLPTGDPVLVFIPRGRRIGLSLRQALDDSDARTEFDAFLGRAAAGRSLPGLNDGEDDGTAGSAAVGEHLHP